MKRNFLFMSMLAALFMAGCSQEEITPDGEDNGNGETVTHYMAVNLVSSDAIGTRAANGYEDGTSVENKVSKVRFYFFNGVGGAANVKLLNGSYVNFYDWVPESQTPEGPDDNDVEKKLSATIVINTGAGDKLPQMMAAVLNPTMVDNNSRSLTQLKGIAADYATANLTRNGTFVMYNSIFNGENGDGAVAITGENLQKDPNDAKDHAVTIYVERSVAKVKVSLGEAVSAAGSAKLALKDKNDKALKIIVNEQEKQVYLKLNGWRLTADTDKGNLVKKINPGWSGWDWNATHRSFWAINYLQANNRYYKYSDIKTSLDSALYTNENAQKDGINADTEKGQAQNNTKVILKGTLCDENDNPFTIVRHVGTLFADACSDEEGENLIELKKSILTQLAVGTQYYFEQGSGADKKRVQIGTDDLEIVIADQTTAESDDSQNCYVYARLTDGAKGKRWYNSSDLTETTPVPLGEINTRLKNNVDKALVWKSGMTYYYYEIKHLNDEPGVVRNHVYKTTVTKIAGLGTPVYDPGQVIYPEKPDANDHYIAAKVDILSWRIVSNDNELVW